MRIVLLLMGVYLAVMAALALKYDWQFFMNDAIALTVFAILAIGLWVIQGPHRRHR
jgi:hypothetical protein